MNSIARQAHRLIPSQARRFAAQAGGEGNTVFKKDLVAEVVKDTNLEAKQVAAVVESLLSHVKTALCNGDKVNLTGFGSFSGRSRKGFVSGLRDRKSGEPVQIPDRVTLVFKTGRPLREALRSGNSGR